MTLPAVDLTSVEFLLVAGRAVFLLFSFVIAAVTFTAWRRATKVQTEQVLSQTLAVLQRLAELEARVDATKVTISQLGDRLERPAAAPQGGVAGAQATLNQPTTSKGGVLGAAGTIAGASLPFTGFPLWAAVLIAIALIAAGLMLRRRGPSAPRI